MYRRAYAGMVRGGRLLIVLFVSVWLSLAPISASYAEEATGIEQVGVANETPAVEQASTSEPAVVEQQSEPQEVPATETQVSESVEPSITEESVPIAEESATQAVANEQSSSAGEQNVQPAIMAVEVSDLLHSGVTITQLQTSGGTNRSGEELIELRNNSQTAVDITNWKVRYASAASSSFGDVATITVDDGVGWRLMLGAGDTYVLASSGFLAAHPGFISDETFTRALANDAGQLIVQDAASLQVSGLSWGNSNVTEGIPAEMPRSYVIDRKMRSDGWHQNTHDNKTDFQTGALRSAYDVGQASLVFDACLNVADIQPAVPSGMYRNETDGTCTDIPPAELNLCEGLTLTEIGANLTRQYIELHNSTENPVNLSGCVLQTNRSTTKSYVFSDGIQLAPGGYKVVYIDETDLTLTKTSSGMVYLLSEDAKNEVDSVDYAASKVDTSWSFVDGSWVQSYELTAGEANIYAEYPACDDGYYRNLETGRCNKIIIAEDPVPCAADQFRNLETGRCNKIATSTLTPCKEGQYRSEETNRCRSIAATAASVLKPCADDQFRNPETNRCKKIASADDILQPCDSGYERNPDTNRCRKVVSTSATALPFAVENVSDTARAFMAWWALGGVVLLGAGYAAWEWRQELKTMLGSRGRKDT